MASNQEIARRRTFAIIAHPDAGKTSLTEMLVPFGGQIQVAGAVKSNKIKKTATSDWMDIETAWYLRNHFRNGVRLSRL